jgi:hypothetical protein
LSYTPARKVTATSARNGSSGKWHTGRDSNPQHAVLERDGWFTASGGHLHGGQCCSLPDVMVRTMGLEPMASTLATSRSTWLNYVRVTTMMSVVLSSNEKLTTCIVMWSGRRASNP